MKKKKLFHIGPVPILLDGLNIALMIAGSALILKAIIPLV